jgi:hypothetical protein
MEMPSFNHLHPFTSDISYIGYNFHPICWVILGNPSDPIATGLVARLVKEEQATHERVQVESAVWQDL